MPAVLTPRASSAARSPGMREITQICGRRARIAERRPVELQLGGRHYISLWATQMDR